jgi:hypothetical protein
MDLHSKNVLSWKLSNSLDADFCLEALEIALSNPRGWARSIRCWQQPAAAWINEPPYDTTAKEELLFLKAA